MLSLPHLKEAVPNADTTPAWGGVGGLLLLILQHCLYLTILPEKILFSFKNDFESFAAFYSVALLLRLS